VVLHPGQNGGLEIELVGEIGAMMDLAIAHGPAPRLKGGGRDLFVRSVKVVAGTCNHLDLLLIG
jgi:hypothetical protein